MFQKGAFMDDVTILGIDPGLANTGWGVVRTQGPKVVPVAYGCITTPASDELPDRLGAIHDMLCGAIDRYGPSAFAAEGIYFGANSASAMLTAQARGAALVACASHGLEFAEYTPMQIKLSLVGTGTAEKEQVQYMVKAVLGLDVEPTPDHAADALAAAITHARMRPVRELEKNFSERVAGGGSSTGTGAASGASAGAGAASAKMARERFDSCVAAALERDAAAERARSAEGAVRAGAGGCAR